MAATTWEQFEKEYDFKNKFGEEAFKALRNIPFNEANREDATKMVNFVNLPATEDNLTAQVKAALNMQHTPRGDISEGLSAEIKSKNKQSFQPPKWAKNFEPAIQNIVDNFHKELGSSYGNRPLTQQYDNALRQMLRHRAELKLRATLRPTPGSKPKPIPR